MPKDFQGNFLKLTNSDISISLDKVAKNKEKSTVEKKFQKIFDFFDKDKSGDLSTDEINNLLELLIQSAIKNNNMELEEVEAEEILNNAKNADGKTLKDENIEINEIFGFVKSLEQEDNVDSENQEDNQSLIAEINYIKEALTKEKTYNPKLVERLLFERRFINHGKSVLRFDAEEIIEIANKYPRNPDLTEKLLSDKTISLDGFVIPRFNSLEICELIDSYQQNPELIERLLSEKTDNDTEIRPKFNGFQISVITDNYVKHPTFVEKLLSEQMVNDDGRAQTRFSSFEINDILDAYAKNQELTEKLLSECIIDNNGRNIPRFNGYEIINIVELYSNYDSNMVDNLLNDSQEKFTGREIKLLVENQQEWFDLKNIKNPQNQSEYLLTNRDILNILSGYNDILGEPAILTQTNDLSGVLNIFKNQELLNLISDGKTENSTLTFIRQKQDNGYYQIIISDSNSKNMSIIDFDLNNNGSPAIVSIEKHTQKDNIITTQKEFSNGSKIEEEIMLATMTYNGENRDIQQGYRKVFYDSNGNKIRTEEITPSDKIPGEYTIKVYDNKNKLEKEHNIGSVKTSFITGKKRSRKRLTSAEGTTTREVKIIGKNSSGNIYTIRDKDGNVLLHTKHSLKKVDDNHYQSEVDGQNYDVKFDNGKITASKIDDKGNIVDTIVFGSDILDPNLTDLFKQLTGDYFFKIKACGLKRIEIGGLAEKDNACYNNHNKAIYVSEELKNDPFVFAHELGHALDFTILQNLNSDPEFIRIWTEELESYKANSGDTEALSIKYFTDETRSKNSAKEECIAEAHAIISGYTKTDYAKMMGTRSIILEHNFPRLIAYVANAINNPEEYIKNRNKNSLINKDTTFY